MFTTLTYRLLTAPDSDIVYVHNTDLQVVDYLTVTLYMFTTLTYRLLTVPDCDIVNVHNTDLQVVGCT